LSRRPQTVVALALIAAELCAFGSRLSTQGGCWRPFDLGSAPSHGVASSHSRLLLCARDEGLLVRRLAGLVLRSAAVAGRMYDRTGTDRSPSQTLRREESRLKIFAYTDRFRISHVLATSRARNMSLPVECR